MSEQEWLEKLEQYEEDTLPLQDRTELQWRLNNDVDFNKKAQEHLRLIKSLRSFDQRKKIKNELELMHEKMQREPSVNLTPEKKVKEITAFGKYWPMIAVAASVALISTFSTLYLTKSLEKEQKAYYKEMGRRVEQIKKSQSLILADIAESKEKSAPTPAPVSYMGTGFLISRNGYVATSYHIIKNADSVYIENKRFGSFKVSVLASDAAKDVSILKIESDSFNPLTSLPYTIIDSESSLGEEVYTLGFPREDIVFGEGSISASTGYKQDSAAYQISVPVNPGNSGGPLFNAKGDVVGIISGLQTETSGTAFATKSSVLLETVRAIPDSTAASLKLPLNNSLKGLPRVQQLSKWKDYVFMIRVYSDPSKN